MSRILIVLVVVLIAALPAAAAPAPPYNLHAVDVTTNSITIAWDCDEPSVDYFEVWYWTDTAKEFPIQVFAYDTEIVKLSSGTMYNIAVIAVLKGGDKIQSDTIQVTTLTAPFKRAVRLEK
jgi:hypothetical protein